LGAAFVAVALVAVAFVAEAFLAGAFLAGAFFTGAFAGATPVPAAALLPWARRDRDDCTARWSRGGRLSTITVMWLVRLRIRKARPCARGSRTWLSARAA
jgi:hypothetical protein